MAVISGASRKEERSGLYAMRSMVQPQAAVSAIEPSAAMSSASGTQVTAPANSDRIAISAMKAPIMNTSPCAKLIMPTMP